MSTEPERYDSLLIRCPRLGGQVTFGYCRNEGGDLPCLRIIACWQSTLPIADFLKKTLNPEQLERFAGMGPKEKIATLVELIESVKKDLNPWA
jgi:hypothetical protein